MTLITEYELAGFSFEEGEEQRKAGERLAASYVNFYITNGGVLIPQFEDEMDAEAVNIIGGGFFPEGRYTRFTHAILLSVVGTFIVLHSRYRLIPGGWEEHDMRKTTVAAIQMGCGSDVKENIEKASELIREAAAQGAQVILPPELFERPYFCQERRYEYYGYARTLEEDDAVIHMKKLAKELETVIPVSFYEAGDHRQMFNSVAVIDADGSVPILGCDSMPHWRRCMMGHAACNLMPVIAANRIGTEDRKYI